MKTRVPLDDDDHHRRKPIFPPSSSCKNHTNTKRSYFIRSLPFLLLIIYVSTSGLRLVSSPSSSTPTHPCLLTSMAAGGGEDLTKSTPLEAHREMLNSPTICQAHIDGKYNSGAPGTGDFEGAGALCCDRSHHRTDVCYMRGDIRTKPKSSSILLYDSGTLGRRQPPQRIRPYTRKWEKPIMATIDELTLVPVEESGPTPNEPGACDVRHDVPAVVLSTGGYTGNVYHEFNDGLIPLYVTAERFEGEVVFVILEYHPWWFTKYSAVVEKLSKHKPIDFGRDRRVHCFPEMIVGMRIHGELSIDPQLMSTGKTIQDFQKLLFQSFGPSQEIAPPLPLKSKPKEKPKIAIFIRSSSRAVLNLRSVLRHCRRLGFQPSVLKPKCNTPLSEVHEVLSTADVMLAVHGAAMTHLLFARPGTVLLQVVPLGLDWAADEYYGQPARKLGLKYVAYKVDPAESSLSKEYDGDDPVIADPGAITSKGWQETKRIYLQHQNVTLDLRRFGKVLSAAYSHVCAANRRRCL